MITGLALIFLDLTFTSVVQARFQNLVIHQLASSSISTLSTDGLQVHATKDTNFFKQSRHAILGMVEGIVSDEGLMKGVERFARSLRVSNSSANIILFGSKLPSPPILRRLGNFGVIWVTYSPGFASKHKLVEFSTVRFFLYKEFLDLWSDHFDAVMVTDVTDVVFQRDPFSALSLLPPRHKNQGIIAALEVDKIELPDINAEWLAQCFGHVAYWRLKGEYVSCSGTTIGTLDHMKEYLRRMCDESSRNLWCGLQGADQGVHNYVIHNNLVRKVLKTDFFHGPIATLDDAFDLHFDSVGRLLNADNQIYHVVHQINRCRDYMIRRAPAQSFNCSDVKQASWMDRL
eukprot:GILI01025991.1.p1 GENE.GILI01025991.1~~GILI01025991.1.p1  ORF type:complete len:398 (-),score=36.98 GILI01025991.1:77-1111(-)